MKVRLVLLELSAILALPAFAVAQATTSPDGSVNSGITCAPLVTPPASPGAKSSPMAEMCTAADPWQGKMTGVKNDQDKVFGRR